jgi:hypothetical protein
MQARVMGLARVLGGARLTEGRWWSVTVRSVAVLLRR